METHKFMWRPETDDFLKLNNGKVISGWCPLATGLITACNDAAFLTQF